MKAETGLSVLRMKRRWSRFTVIICGFVGQSLNSLVPVTTEGPSLLVGAL